MLLHVVVVALLHAADYLRHSQPRVLGPLHVEQNAGQRRAGHQFFSALAALVVESNRALTVSVVEDRLAEDLVLALSLIGQAAKRRADLAYEAFVRLRAVVERLASIACGTETKEVVGETLNTFFSSAGLSPWLRLSR